MRILKQENGATNAFKRTDETLQLPNDLSRLNGIDSLVLNGGSIETGDEEVALTPAITDSVLKGELRRHGNFGTTGEKDGHPRKPVKKLARPPRGIWGYIQNERRRFTPAKGRHLHEFDESRCLY